MYDALAEKHGLAHLISLGRFQAAELCEMTPKQARNMLDYLRVKARAQVAAEPTALPAEEPTLPPKPEGVVSGRLQLLEPPEGQVSGELAKLPAEESLRLEEDAYVRALAMQDETSRKEDRCAAWNVRNSRTARPPSGPHARALQRHHIYLFADGSVSVVRAR